MAKKNNQKTVAQEGLTDAQRHALSVQAREAAATTKPAAKPAPVMGGGNLQPTKGKGISDGFLNRVMPNYGLSRFNFASKEEAEAALRKAAGVGPDGYIPTRPGTCKPADRKPSPYFETPVSEKCTVTGRSLNKAGHAFVPNYAAVADREDSEALLPKLFFKVQRQGKPFFEGKFFCREAAEAISKACGLEGWWKLFHRYSAVIERRKSARNRRTGEQVSAFLGNKKVAGAENLTPENFADMDVRKVVNQDGSRSWVIAKDGGNEKEGIFSGLASLKKLMNPGNGKHQKNHRQDDGDGNGEKGGGKPSPDSHRGNKGNLRKQIA